MVDGRPGSKPDSLVVASVTPGPGASPAELEALAARASAAGCHAIRLPFGFPGVPLVGPGTRGGRAWSSPGGGAEVSPATLGQFATAWLGRLAVVVAVHDLAALEAVVRVGGIAMFSVPAPAATDPRLLARVAGAGHPVLLEVNLLGSAEIEAAARQFAPGQLTLMWSQLAPCGSALETVEGLFALIRLRRYGRPVGYVAASVAPLVIAAAVGFGAAVVDVPLGETSEVSGTAESIGGLVARLERLREDGEGTFLRSSDLDLVDEQRPSLVAARPIRRGETLTVEMLAVKPPYRGLSPGSVGRVVGRRALYDLAQEEPITFGVIEP